ncbi:RNA-binding protein 26 [Colias croceus]|uniref:RNA-binding protein 26 n=1 Tax=Colias crocea TaxID=72248 RepID=UPI001E27A1A7|nr:RNA-binding protein 26 [Colias croceus]
MIIENPDVFKSWLTSILEPLCDADPAALAKYVYALVKKDKPLEELREGMLDQLDVFLQQETKPFVDMLFKALDSQEYLKPVEGLKKEPSPVLEQNEVEETKLNEEVENHVPLAPQTEDKPRIRSPITAETREAREAREVREREVREGEAREREVREREAREREGREVRHRVVMPRRHPHNEHTLVKVLPTELLEEPVEAPRRRDRRGENMIRDKDDRRRRRSRSWERRARARRHPRDDKRRPPSRSPSPRGRYRNRSPPTDRLPSRSRSRSPVGVRERDGERERDRLRVPRELERDRMSRDREHRDRVSRERDRERSRDRSMSPHIETRVEHKDTFKRRCRDFDVKGYCMRGDLCEWDHGVDPVVLEDAALTRVLALPPPVPEYNPATPDIWVGGGFGAFPPQHHAQRELVPIPRVRHEVPPGAMPPQRHSAPKKNFDFNRLGAPRPPLPPKMPNCSLEVKKVPQGLNDITHLNNHFSKFGKIVNIQVCFEGDPEAALITFSNPTEANVAYKSTEAVLNNRFIKLFWHNPENKQENAAPGGGQQINKQTDNRHPMSHNKVFINRDNIKASENKLLAKEKEKEKLKETNGATDKPTPTTNTTSNTSNTNTTQSVVAADKRQQVLEMHKRAQALLQTQLSQQKLLIGRLESGNVTEQQKSALMEAINAAQEGIEKLRKELVAYNGLIKHMQEESVSRSMSRLQVSQANAKKPKTAAEAQKEILDAELDIITKQQEGQDVTELAKKIAEMRRQMAIQFPSHAGVRRIHSRGGRFNPAMRYTRATALAGAGLGAANKLPHAPGSQSVDHRPRTLLVSGFEPDDLEALQAHFAQYGEIVGRVVNLSVPELTLQYRARAHAELAALRGRHYNDRTLSITWVPNNKPLTSVVPNTASNGDAQENSKEIQSQQDRAEDALLRFDEEDEDEAEEDRTWRR